MPLIFKQLLHDLWLRPQLENLKISESSLSALEKFECNSEVFDVKYNCAVLLLAR